MDWAGGFGLVAGSGVFGGAAMIAKAVWILGGWLLLAVVVGALVGMFIAEGSRSARESARESEERKVE